MNARVWIILLTIGVSLWPPRLDTEAASIVSIMQREHGTQRQFYKLVPSGQTDLKGGTEQDGDGNRIDAEQPCEDGHQARCQAAREVAAQMLMSHLALTCHHTGECQGMGWWPIDHHAQALPPMTSYDASFSNAARRLKVWRPAPAKPLLQFEEVQQLGLPRRLEPVTQVATLQFAANEDRPSKKPVWQRLIKLGPLLLLLAEKLLGRS